MYACGGSSRICRRPGPPRRSRPRASPRSGRRGRRRRPRSWVISRTAVPVLAGQLVEVVEDPALHGDVEGAGRLVGDDQLRVRRRARSRSAPAGACRRTARAGTAGPAPRVGQPGPVEQLDRVELRGCAGRRARAPAAPRRPGRRPAAPGSARPSGPAGPARSARPRTARNARSDSAVRSSVAVGSRRCRRRRGRCRGSSPSTACARVDLPEPDSPTTATTSPGSIVSDTPSTARDVAGALPVGHAQVRDLQQGLGRHRDASAIRRPAPGRSGWPASTIAAIIRPGSAVSHHAVAR